MAVRLTTLGQVEGGTELRHDYGHGQQTLLLTYGFVDGIPSSSRIGQISATPHATNRPTLTPVSYTSRSTNRGEGCDGARRGRKGEKARRLTGHL